MPAITRLGKSSSLTIGSVHGATNSHGSSTLDAQNKIALALNSYMSTDICFRQSSVMSLRISEVVTGARQSILGRLVRSTILLESTKELPLGPSLLLRQRGTRSQAMNLGA